MAYLVWAIGFVICLARSGSAVDRLVPDPGIDFVTEAYSNNWIHTFSNVDGYLNFLPRFFGEVFTHFPLASAAVISSVMTAAIWALCTTFVWQAISAMNESKAVALLGSLSIPLIFAASESSINNLWNVKWILLPTLAIVLTVPKMTRKRPLIVIFLIVITGLSHAYIVIPTLIFCAVLILRRSASNAEFRIAAVLVVMSIVQGAAFVLGADGFKKYGNNTVYLPWSGMGLFWYAVWLLPTLLSVTALSAIFIVSRRPWRTHQSLFLVSLYSLFFSALSVAQFGIKDSPAVMTVGISVVAIILGLSELRTKMPRFSVFVAAGVLIVVGVLSVHYFPASWWLKSGPRWSTAVEAASKKCEMDSVEKVEIETFMRSTEVECRHLP